MSRSPLLELAAAADVPAIVALRTEASNQLTSRHGPGPWSRGPTERGVDFERRSSALYVVRDGPAIMATLRLATRKPWAIDLRYFTPVKRPLYLLALAVSPSRQRQGLGHACLAAAVELARAQDAGAINLDAYDAPAGAGPFYEKCGFREVGRASYRGCPLRYYQRML